MFFGAFLSFPVSARDKAPSWIKHHQEYIKKTGDDDWARWIKKLKDPRAIELGKAWAQYQGYDTPSLVAQSKLAPGVKPGVVINEENYKDYPGLKELMMPAAFARIKKGAYAQLAEIPIVPTTQMYPTRARQEWTIKEEGKAGIGKNDELLNWKAGIPFPKPAKGVEFAHNAQCVGMGDDQCAYSPVHFLLYDRKGKKERLMKINLYWRRYRGRTDVPPTPIDLEHPDIMDKGSIVAFYPFDIRGFSGVRSRVMDPLKEDEFITYIPALRRVRRMAGSDTQDPLLGSDIPWEDWGGWWSKISNVVWRNVDFKFLGKKEVLFPIYGTKPPVTNVETGRIGQKWERRFSWILEVIIGDPRYMYSRRIVSINPQFGNSEYSENFDKRGQLWRSYLMYYYFDPITGTKSAWGADVTDHVNRHRSWVKFDCIPNCPETTDDYFNLRFLTKMAR